MTSYSQFSAVGLVFIAVAACMILGLMRNSIPFAVRRGTQVVLFLSVLGGGLWYASLKMTGGRGWSRQWSTPASAAAPVISVGNSEPAKATDAPVKRKAPVYSASPVPTKLRSGTMREVSPEEAARLLERARALRPQQ